MSRDYYDRGGRGMRSRGRPYIRGWRPYNSARGRNTFAEDSANWDFSDFKDSYKHRGFYQPARGRNRLHDSRSRSKSPPERRSYKDKRDDIQSPSSSSSREDDDSSSKAVGGQKHKKPLVAYSKKRSSDSPSTREKGTAKGSSEDATKQKQDWLKRALLGLASQMPSDDGELNVLEALLAQRRQAKASEVKGRRKGEDEAEEREVNVRRSRPEKPKREREEQKREKAETEVVLPGFGFEEEEGEGDCEGGNGEAENDFWSREDAPGGSESGLGLSFANLGSIEDEDKFLYGDDENDEETVKLPSKPAPVASKKATRPVPEEKNSKKKKVVASQKVVRQKEVVKEDSVDSEMPQRREQMGKEHRPMPWQMKTGPKTPPEEDFLEPKERFIGRRLEIQGETRPFVEPKERFASRSQETQGETRPYGFAASSEGQRYYSPERDRAPFRREEEALRHRNASPEVRRLPSPPRVPLEPVLAAPLAYDPTIENILKSIGFDFGMAKLVAQGDQRERDKTPQLKQPAENDEDQDYDINRASSFLGSGLKNIDLGSIFNSKQQRTQETPTSLGRAREEVLQSQESYEEKARRYREEQMMMRQQSLSGASKDQPLLRQTQNQAVPQSQQPSREYSNSYEATTVRADDRNSNFPDQRQSFSSENRMQSPPLYQVSESQFSEGQYSEGQFSGDPYASSLRRVAGAVRQSNLRAIPTVDLNVPTSGFDQGQSFQEEETVRRTVTKGPVRQVPTEKEAVGDQRKVMVANEQPKAAGRQFHGLLSPNEGGRKDLTINASFKDEQLEKRTISIPNKVQAPASASAPSEQGKKGKKESSGESAKRKVVSKKRSDSSESSSSASSSSSSESAEEKEKSKKEKKKTKKKKEGRSLSKKKDEDDRRRSTSKVSENAVQPKRSNTSLEVREFPDEGPEFHSRGRGFHQEGGEEFAQNERRGFLFDSYEEMIRQKNERRRTKIEQLEQELRVLKSHYGAIRARMSREGPDEPNKSYQLAQNNKVQLNIGNQISALSRAVERDEENVRLRQGRRFYPQRQGRYEFGHRDFPTEKRRSLEGKVSREKSEEGADKKLKSRWDADSPQGRRKSKEGPDEDRIYEYIDQGGHVCRCCRVVSDSVSELLKHLESDDHQTKVDKTERPWVTESQKKPEIKKSEMRGKRSVLTSIKGGEFLSQVRGYYCSLCNEFADELSCVENHLLSKQHGEKYRAYVDKNKVHEPAMQAYRMSAVNVVSQSAESSAAAKSGDKRKSTTSASDANSRTEKKMKNEETKEKAGKAEAPKSETVYEAKMKSLEKRKRVFSETQRQPTMKEKQEKGSEGGSSGNFDKEKKGTEKSQETLKGEGSSSPTNSLSQPAKTTPTATIGGGGFFKWKGPGSERKVKNLPMPASLNEEIADEVNTSVESVATTILTSGSDGKSAVTKVAAKPLSSAATALIPLTGKLPAAKKAMTEKKGETGKKDEKASPFSQLAKSKMSTEVFKAVPPMAPITSKISAQVFAGKTKADDKKVQDKMAEDKTADKAKKAVSSAGGVNNGGRASGSGGNVTARGAAKKIDDDTKSDTSEISLTEGFDFELVDECNN